MNRLVYNFKDGNKEMKSLLGGKGANLAEMVNIGLNIPPGFTVTTEACIEYYERNKEIWQELIGEIEEKLKFWKNEFRKDFWRKRKSVTCFSKVRICIFQCQE